MLTLTTQKGTQEVPMPKKEDMPQSPCEPTCTQDSIARWTQANAATWARQRLTRIQEGSDE